MSKLSRTGKTTINMKTITTICAIVTGWAVCGLVHAQKPDTLWVQHADRFTANEPIRISTIDSLEFFEDSYKAFQTFGKVTIGANRKYRDGGTYTFQPDRWLVKPNYYSSVDYSKESSQWSFARSQESTHFAVFWEKGLTRQSNGLINGGASSSVVNVNSLIGNVERIWNVYVDSLGFLEPGSSLTDKTKIQMYIVNQSDWRADGSGTDGTYWKYKSNTSTDKTSTGSVTGIFHCNPWAASSLVTVAHEIGHTFQYLVGADLGSSHGLNYVLGENSSGNEWWEDCANWQAHKVYPANQFSENWGNNMNMHHMNILHEDARYNNCYYQDWWCQQHGLKTIGRIWREAIKPEDPIQAYMRIFDLDEQTFADEQWLGYAHIASMDIDRWYRYGRIYINKEKQRLVKPTSAQTAYIAEETQGWYVVDSAYCVQNYGYNANPLTVPAQGTVIKAHFKGISGAPGYRAVNASYAGWRYGMVAYSTDGTRTYGEMGRDASGTVTLIVPAKCQYIWLVVMGAPTTYWTHSWDNSAANDEQWPYAVRLEGTSIKQ